jgi:hypothetical protein
LRYLNFVRSHFFAIATGLMNLIYFLPCTITWLTWRSGVTMGYVGIELIFNYIIHIFFIYSCISLVVEGIYRIYFFWALLLIFLASFMFAFRVMQLITFAPLTLYAYIFITLFKQLKDHISEKELSNLTMIGFFISIFWLILDIKFFGGNFLAFIAAHVI